jgi:hypothetical protein
MCRSSIQLLRRRQVRLTTKKAKKQEKAQRHWKLQSKVEESETASVTSVASSLNSSGTANTVVEKETPLSGGQAEKEMKGVTEAVDCGE